MTRNVIYIAHGYQIWGGGPVWPPLKNEVFRRFDNRKPLAIVRASLRGKTPGDTPENVGYGGSIEKWLPVQSPV
jgi:hypothetical protein